MTEPRTDQPGPPRAPETRRFRTVVDASALAARAADARIRGEVRFDDGSRALYATDGSNYRQVPIGVVIPRDVDDVVATVATCRAIRRAGAVPRRRHQPAGQCCNVAVVMDFSKYMHHVLGVDPDKQARRASQPGCVLDILRGAAEKHHLTFGPDPSTHNHCTLGGMIGNNSCGVHSLHGPAGPDGPPTTSHELEILHLRRRADARRRDRRRTSWSAIIRGRRPPRRDLRRGSRRSATATPTRSAQRFPKIPRRVSGYNLDDLLPENGFHVARALVGTEGTCVTILEATLRLVPSPPARSLLVLGYPDVFQRRRPRHGDPASSGRSAWRGIDDLLVE